MSLASRVSVEEVAPALRTIEGVETNRTGFVGVTERGPVNTPVLVQSFDEFRSVFGGYLVDSDLPSAVEMYFTEGGTFAYIVRVVHVTDVTDPGTATSAPGDLDLLTPPTAPTSATILGSVVGPFDLASGDQLDVTVDGAGPTAAVVTAASATVTSGSTEPFALSDGQILTVEVNGGGVQSADFLTLEFVNIAAATAAEVVDVLNAKLTGVSVTESAGAVVITTDRAGTSATVEVTGGSANSVLNFPAGVQSGTGNVADVDEVTVSELETIVEAAVAGVDVTSDAGRFRITSLTTGGSSTLQIAAGSLQTALGLSTATATGGTGAAVPTLRVVGRYDGTYTSDVAVRVQPPTNGTAGFFNIQFIEDGVARTRETFANVSLVPSSSQYVVTVVNADPAAGGSEIVTIVDLLPAVPDASPAQGTFGPLVGGDDGLAGLVDDDYVGGASNSGRTGLRTLDVVLDVSILCVPGQATAQIHNAMITYCEIIREGALFAILDPPLGTTAAEIKDYVETTALLAEISEFAAIYWPRLVRLNPDDVVYGADETLVVAPSGAIAGVFARRDQGRAGVFKAPAGSVAGRLRSAVGVETQQALDVAAQNIVYPARINPLNIPEVAPKIPYINGDRTLRSDGPFPVVPQRRATIFLMTSIRRAIDPLRFENITDRLRRSVELLIRSFLITLLPDDAFASQVADEAFVIDVSEARNPPSKTSRGELEVAIGLAYNTPAEFITIKVGRDQRALLAELGLEE